MTDSAVTNPAVEQLIARSHSLGADPRTTNYGGGNTSAKGTATDPATGGPVELLWVKGSGGDLGTLAPSGLAVLRLDRMRALTGVYPGVEPRANLRTEFFIASFLPSEQCWMQCKAASSAPLSPAVTSRSTTRW